jgi:hypothetical protein
VEPDCEDMGWVHEMTVEKEKEGWWPERELNPRHGDLQSKEARSETLTEAPDFIRFSE